MKGQERGGLGTVSTVLLCCRCSRGTGMCRSCGAGVPSRMSRQPACRQLDKVLSHHHQTWCNNLIHSLLQVDESDIFCCWALKWNKTLLVGTRLTSPLMNFDWFPWKHWQTPFSTRVQAWTKELLNEVTASSHHVHGREMHFQITLVMTCLYEHAQWCEYTGEPRNWARRIHQRESEESN